MQSISPSYPKPEGWGGLRASSVVSSSPGADGGPACLALTAVFAFLGFTENESDFFFFFYLVSTEFMLVEN